MNETEGVIKYHLTHKAMSLPPDWDIASINAWRTHLFQLKLIGQQKKRYLGYGYGNISQRIKGETFIISGTQTGGLETLSINDYCLVIAADLNNNQLSSTGGCQPSSEALSHASVYAQDKDIQCVIHVHSPDIWGATQALNLAHTGQDIAYGTPEMAQAIHQLLDDMPCTQSALFTMLGHEDGVISFGKNFLQAGSLLLDILARTKQL